MDKVCDICGDIGEVGALTICLQCKLGCEHRYCMRKPCMVVPVDWCCEICRSAKIVASNHGLKKVTMEAVKCDLSSKVPQYPKESTQKMFSKGARSNWHENPVERGKTKYLWTNEVKNMPSGDKKGKPKESNAILTPMKENRRMRQTSSVKYIEFSPAKKQKGMGETSRRKTCYIPETDATLSPANAFTSTVPTEDTKKKRQVTEENQQGIMCRSSIILLSASHVRSCAYYRC